MQVEALLLRESLERPSQGAGVTRERVLRKDGSEGLLDAGPSLTPRGSVVARGHVGELECLLEPEGGGPRGE